MWDMRRCVTELLEGRTGQLWNLIVKFDFHHRWCTMFSKYLTVRVMQNDSSSISVMWFWPLLFLFGNLHSCVLCAYLNNEFSMHPSMFCYWQEITVTRQSFFLTPLEWISDRQFYISTFVLLFKIKYDIL